MCRLIIKITNHQSPITNHQSPITNHQSPFTNHDLMKPYIEINGEKIHLPQTVDPHKNEICSLDIEGKTYFLLCRKERKRYYQASGVVMDRKGQELDFHLVANTFVTKTFPLKGLKTMNIKIDYTAGGSTTIQNKE